MSFMLATVSARSSLSLEQISWAQLMYCQPDIETRAFGNIHSEDIRHAETTNAIPSTHCNIAEPLPSS
jgi:hypothetical protein